MKSKSMHDIIRALLIGLLLLVGAALIFICTQISFLFTPISTFISTIMGPFLIAGFLYYLLQPLVKLLNKCHLRGAAASVTAFVLLLVILSAGLAYLIPQLVEQLANLVQSTPHYIREAETFVQDFSQSKLADQLHLTDILSNVNIDQSTIIKYATGYLSTGADSFGTIIGHIGNTLVNIFMAPLVLFYFMKDGSKLSPNIQKFLPPKMRPFVANLLHRMNATMDSYFTGQFLDMLIVGILSCIGYGVTGTPYALIIGIVAGVMNMVPYIGPWLGAVPAILVAMTVSWTQVLLAVLVAVVVQQIDNNFVYPNVIGKSMEIHPLTVLVLLLTAGNMFGLLGVILGIPVYAVTKTVLACLVAEPSIKFFDYMRKDPVMDATGTDVSETLAEEQAAAAAKESAAVEVNADLDAKNDNQDQS